MVHFALSVIMSFGDIAKILAKKSRGLSKKEGAVTEFISDRIIVDNAIKSALRETPALSSLSLS